MNYQSMSKQTLRRLPIYLHYLSDIKDEVENISATGIAEAFGLNDVQVRKDLATVSGSGRPKTGYNVCNLIEQIKRYLNCDKETKTILIGAGNLGKALLSYGGFDDYGLNIIAAFDIDYSVIGKSINGKTVLPMEQIEECCRDNNIQLAILTVPIGVAQSVCDKLVEGGIRAIWNFAPTILRVPGNIIVENENLASSLAVLSSRIHTASAKGEGGEK